MRPHFRGLRDGLEYKFLDCIPARHRELDRNGPETYDGPAWRLATEGRKLTMQAGQGARRSGIQVDRLYSRPSPAYNAGRAWCGWMR